jgi:hypothetical protein
MQIKVAACVALLAGLVLVPFTSLSQAPPPPARHPGEKISFDVHFEGKDAHFIQSVGFELRLQGTAHPDQANLRNILVAGPVGPDKDGIFHPQLTVPPLVAEGEYSVTFTTSTSQYSYEALNPQYENAVSPIRINNDSTFEKPKIVAVPHP